jgi:drug/metabolite transporter (DMT)-like permease
MTQAYKRADVTTILPFNFCKLIWASLIGFFIFAEIPDLWTWVGGAMIFMSGAFIAYREASQKKIVSVITSSAGDIPPVPEPVSSGRS